MRKASVVLVAWVGFARWSGTPLIGQRRKARRAHLGYSALNRAAPTGASPGSLQLRLLPAKPALGLRYLHPFPGAHPDQVGLKLGDHCKHIEAHSARSLPGYSSQASKDLELLIG